MSAKFSVAESHHHYDADSVDVFGFWLYILTDCILFATLFATFVVLTYQGMQPILLKQYIDLYDVLIETFLLLGSNFTFCLSFLSLQNKNIARAQMWLMITFLLGAGFIVIEVREFIHLAMEGFRWNFNGQASSFFALVGTHGLHVSFGLLWILVMMFQMSSAKLKPILHKRMTYLGLFWNFLDIVWIFVFTIVYLMGAM